MMIRRLFIVSITICGLAAAGAPTHAGIQKSVNTAPQSLADTDPVTYVTDAIREWVDDQPDDTGFVMIDIRDDGGITLRWKGELPPAASALVASLQAVAPIKVVPATASLFQIRAMMKDLIATANSNSIQINSLGPSVDYGTLILGIASQDYDRALAIFGDSPLGSFPVSIVHDDMVADPIATRRADTEPYWGADAMRNDDDRACSSGATFTKTSSGDVGTMTDYHCGVSQSYYTYGGSNARIGDAGAGNKPSDTVFIKGQTYGPYIYTGPYNSDSSSAAGVVSGADPAHDANLCADGAFSGQICTDVLVGQTDVYRNVYGVGLVGPGFWLHNENTSGGMIHVLFGGGDSGSPAFKWENSAHTQVGIKGLAVAGDPGTILPCNVGDPDLPRTCYQRGFYSNISTVKDAQNVTLNKIAQ